MKLVNQLVSPAQAQLEFESVELTVPLVEPVEWHCHLMAFEPVELAEPLKCLVQVQVVEPLEWQSQCHLDLPETVHEYEQQSLARIALQQGHGLKLLADHVHSHHRQNQSAPGPGPGQ